MAGTATAGIRGAGARAAVSRRPRRVVDIALAVVLTLVMATALIEDFAHEYLGIAAFVLVAVHQVLNRTWWRALLRGRYTARRVLSTVVNIALVTCMCALLASSVVVSSHAFGWLPAISGAWWARTAHLAGSYWAFICAALHLGFHVQPAFSCKLRAFGSRRLVAIAVLAVLAATGAVCAVQLDLMLYATLGSPFVFVDASIPLTLRFAQWACVGVFLTELGAAMWALAGTRRSPGRSGANVSAERSERDV